MKLTFLDDEGALSVCHWLKFCSIFSKIALFLDSIC
jgi:hypothetical protein